MNDSTWSGVTTKLVFGLWDELPSNRAAFGLIRLEATGLPETESRTSCHSGLPNRFLRGAEGAVPSESGNCNSTSSSRSRLTPLPRNPLKGFILARIDVSPLEAAADEDGGANKFRDLSSAGPSVCGFELYWDSGNASLPRKAGGPE